MNTNMPGSTPSTGSSLVPEGFQRAVFVNDSGFGAGPAADTISEGRTTMCDQGSYCENASVCSHLEVEEPPMKKTRMLCCNCGTPTEANPMSMCFLCVQNNVDITDCLARSIVLPHCRECDRYLGDSRWMLAERESKDLMAILLKKIKGLKKLKLIDAKFIWTEEHNGRLKVQLTLQKEMYRGAVLQQMCVIEFVINNHQCEDCKRSYTPHTWKAVVQVRQKVDHRRSLYHLEQMIIKHDAHEKLLFLSQSPEGLDFFFGSVSHANRFADFVRQWFPVKTLESKTLVSHDSKNNTANYKYTKMLEIAPICRDDMIFLPRKVAAANGGVPQLLLVQKVSTSVSLIDPNTMLGCDIANTKFWEHPFYTVLSKKHLTEFVVLDIEDLEANMVSVKKCGARKKLRLCEVEIAKITDFGNNDITCRVRCHLGHILDVGDHVEGYDFRHATISGHDDENIDKHCEQDVVLVKRKFRIAGARRVARRQWEMKRLEMQEEESNRKGIKREEDDLEAYFQEIEENEDLRKEVNLYKKKAAVQQKEQKRSSFVDAVNLEPEQLDKQEELDEEDAMPEINMDELLDAFENFQVKPGGAIPEKKDDDEESDISDLDIEGMADL